MVSVTNTNRISKQGIWPVRGMKESLSEKVLRPEGGVDVSEVKRKGMLEVTGRAL